MKIDEEDEQQILREGEERKGNGQDGEGFGYGIGLIVAGIVFVLTLAVNLITSGVGVGMFVGEQRVDMWKDVLADIQYQTIPPIQSNKQPPTPVNPLRRIFFSSPNPAPPKMRIVTLTKPQPSPPYNCLLTNGVQLITSTTIKTGQSMLGDAGFGKWVLLLDAFDPLADQLWMEFVASSRGYQYSNANVSVDADYRFIRDATAGCRVLVYTQPQFSISPQQSILISTLISTQSSTSYLRTLPNQPTLPNLNLTTTNLQHLPSSQLAQYLYIFTTDFLRFVTPLSYAYYARYTVEEMLVRPVLTIVQGTAAMGVGGIGMFQGRGFESGKYYGLEQGRTVRKPGEKKSRGPPKQQICFVSYPINPSIPSLQSLQTYLSSLSTLPNIQSSPIILNLPHSPSQPGLLLPIYTHISTNTNYSHLNIRLRIHSEKAVSSLSVYEAAYMFCGRSAVIVSSRHNVRFLEGFVAALQAKIEYKYHYYFAEFQHVGQNGSQIIKINKNNKFQSKTSRYSLPHYLTIFSPLQIFKSDLLKSLYFQLLKCSELDFYQPEASFVVPMQEMVRMSLGIVEGPLFVVEGDREITEVQREQLGSLEMYMRWDQLPYNSLYPIGYNGLDNVAFRRDAPDKIPKIIHQIWLGKGQISPFQMKLHETLKQTNSDFEVRLWRDSDITKQNFPLTYALIQRVREYQRYSTRSYSAPTASLIRYELLHKMGGIYIDFKTEGKKSLSPFLKYELFFIDIDFGPEHYIYPANVGNGIMGAMVNNYHMLLTLTQLISQESFNFRAVNFPKLVGGFVLRRSLSDQELFTRVGFGFQLFSQKPGTGKGNACSNGNSVPDPDQERFRVADTMTGKVHNIDLPCKAYKEAYLIMYKVIARTWLPKPPNSNPNPNPK